MHSSRRLAHSLPFTRGRGGWKVPSVSVIHFHKLPPLISEFMELRWHFAENPPAFVPTGIFETHFKEPFHPRSVLSLFVM